MGEKFRPENQPSQENQTSPHERAEVLSPLGQAFLDHILAQIVDPDERAQIAPDFRRRVAAMGQEELERFLGLRHERRGVIDWLRKNRFFRAALFTTTWFSAGAAIATSYRWGEKSRLDESAEITVKPSPEPEPLMSRVSDVNPSELESHEPDYVAFERLDPTLTPDRVRRLLLTLPQGFVDEIERFGYRPTAEALPDEYGLPGSNFAAATEKSAYHLRSSIYFYPASIEGTRLADSREWFGAAAHESFHANDDERSLGLSDGERRKLRARLLERVEAQDRFRSDYVESIKIPVKVEPDPTKRARREKELKATEYFAELGSAYLTSDKPEEEFSERDLTLIRWFISLKDPHFDQKAARAQHLEVLREMQQLREGWQQAEASVAQNEMVSIVRGLPVSADERDFFQRRLSGLRSSAEENVSTEVEGIEARAFRADLVHSLQRWGVSSARRDWAWSLINLYDHVEDLRQNMGQSDFRRDQVLAIAEFLAYDAKHVTNPPEGATAQEAETFRSEILRLHAAHGGRLETALEPGEYADLLDWGSEDPAWALNALGLEAASSDASLDKEMTDRHRGTLGLSWMEDIEEL